VAISGAKKSRSELKDRALLMSRLPVCYGLGISREWRGIQIRCLAAECARFQKAMAALSTVAVAWGFSYSTGRVAFAYCTTTVCTRTSQSLGTTRTRRM
jgi:hypothetical protein